jgi:hypothetical protein
MYTKQAPLAKLIFWNVACFIDTIQLTMKFTSTSLPEQTGDARSTGAIGRNQGVSETPC